MPRTAQEILDHADELAARFEAHEPGDEAHDATELRLVREAFLHAPTQNAHSAMPSFVLDTTGTPGHQSAPWSARPVKQHASATANPSTRRSNQADREYAAPHQGPTRSPSEAPSQ